MSKEIKRFKIEPASTDDSMVCTLSAPQYDCITVHTRTVSCQNQLIIRHLKVQSLSESADYQTSESTVPDRISWLSDIWKYSPFLPYYQKPAQARFLNWSYGAIMSRIKWYRLVSFEVIVVNMKPVFRFSCDSVPLKLKKARRLFILSV
jgi:hypothetical protein